MVVEPRRIDREYSQSSQRDANATQALPYQTEDITVELTSGRRSRANVRSNRSTDAYKLELQPDSQERSAPSIGDDEDEDDLSSDEKEADESGEEEQEEQKIEDDKVDDEMTPQNTEEAEANDNHV